MKKIAENKIKSFEDNVNLVCDKKSLNEVLDKVFPGKRVARKYFPGKEKFSFMVKLKVPRGAYMNKKNWIKLLSDKPREYVVEQRGIFLDTIEKIHSVSVLTEQPGSTLIRGFIIDFKPVTSSSRKQHLYYCIGPMINYSAIITFIFPEKDMTPNGNVLMIDHKNNKHSRYATGDDQRVKKMKKTIAKLNKFVNKERARDDKKKNASKSSKG